MKARIAKETELVLWHGFDRDVQQKEMFDKALEILSVPQKKIEEWMWNQTIFSCLETDSDHSERTDGNICEIPEEELILIKGMKGKRLDQLLKTLKEFGVGSAVLKAVVTPYNCRWTFLKLYRELCRERELTV